VSLRRGWKLARKAFALTARYDGNIATELERLSAANGSTELSKAPRAARAAAFHLQRAGTNCATARIRTQRAALYVPVGSSRFGLPRRAIAGQGAFLQQSDGPGIGLALPGTFLRPAAVIVKTQQSLRRLPNRTRWRKPTRKRLLRSHFRVRRRDGIQPSARRATAEEVSKLFVGASRARLEPAALDKNSRPRKICGYCYSPRPNRWADTEWELNADSAACSCRSRTVRTRGARSEGGHTALAYP